eukprot:gene7272-5117_t
MYPFKFFPPLHPPQYLCLSPRQVHLLVYLLVVSTASDQGRRVTQPAQMKRTSPNDPAGLKKRADEKFEAGDYTQAVDLYSQALRASGASPAAAAPSPAVLYGNRSVAQYMAGDFKESLRDALEAFRMAPANFKMLHRAACAAWTLGDLRQATDLLSRIPAKERTGNIKVDYERCRDGLAISEKLKDVANTPAGDMQYKKLMELFPECPTFYLQAAKSLVQRAQFLSAATLLQTLPPETRSPAYNKLLGQCYFMAGCEFFKDAIAALESGAADDEDCSRMLAHVRRVESTKSKGDSAYKAGDFPLAAECYALAIELSAGNKKVLRIFYCNRAAANKEMLRPRQSVEDCTKAIENDPQFSKAYARRARSYLDLDDPFAAVEDFKKAVQFDSTNDRLQEEYFAAKMLLKKKGTKEGGAAGAEDYYSQLGVAKTASEKEIKTKFRELSLRWHPDKCVALDDLEKARAEVKFKLINEAYSVLSDPQKRREYDMRTVGGAAVDSDFPFGQRLWRDPNLGRWSPWWTCSYSSLFTHSLHFISFHFILYLLYIPFLCGETEVILLLLTDDQAARDENRHSLPQLCCRCVSLTLTLTLEEALGRAPASPSSLRRRPCALTVCFKWNIIWYCGSSKPLPQLKGSHPSQDQLKHIKCKQHIQQFPPPPSLVFVGMPPSLMMSRSLLSTFSSWVFEISTNPFNRFSSALHREKSYGRCSAGEDD